MLVRVELTPGPPQCRTESTRDCGATFLTDAISDSAVMNWAYVIFLAPCLKGGVRCEQAGQPHVR